MTLEQALEFIDNDELVEVTPDNIRIRKKSLKESDRKREGSAAKKNLSRLDIQKALITLVISVFF